MGQIVWKSYYFDSFWQHSHVCWMDCWLANAWRSKNICRAHVYPFRSFAQLSAVSVARITAHQNNNSIPYILHSRALSCCYHARTKRRRATLPLFIDFVRLGRSGKRSTQWCYAIRAWDFNLCVFITYSIMWHAKWAVATFTISLKWENIICI